MGIDDLFVFEGNDKEDTITKITIDYHRLTKNKPGILPERMNYEYLTWDYGEHIIIDRYAGSLKYVQNNRLGCKESHKYEVEVWVESLLDSFYAEALFSTSRVILIM